MLNIEKIRAWNFVDGVLTAGPWTFPADECRDIAEGDLIQVFSPDEEGQQRA
jgi:hypothetical protein